MKLKKLVLVGGLIAGMHAPLHAVGELRSIIHGNLCGPVYEAIICHTPLAIKIVGSSAFLGLQLYTFTVMRDAIKDQIRYERVANNRYSEEMDNRKNFVLSLLAAATTGAITYAVENYLAAQKKDCEQSEELAAAPEAPRA